MKYNIQLVIAGDNLLLSSIVWLGLDDRKAEGKFTWLDGTAPTFTYWRPSEPNDHRNGEDCAEVSYLPTIYYTLPYFTAHNCVIIFCQVSFASYLLRTRIAIFTLYSLCLFYIVYCTLFNAHSAIVCNVFFQKSFVAQYLLAHYSFVHSRYLFQAIHYHDLWHSLLHTMYYVQYIAHYLLRIIFVAHYLLHTICCTLFIAHYLSHTIYCTLFIAHYLLHTFFHPKCILHV